MHKIFNPKLLFGSLRTKCQNSFLPVFLWVINKRCIVLFFIYTLHGRIWEYSSNHGTVLNDWSMAGIFCYLLSRSLKETNFLSLDAAACPGPGRGQSLIIVPFVSWYFPCNPAITRTAIQTITSGRPTTNQLQDWLKTKNQITMFQSLNNSYYYHYLCCLVTIIRTGLFVSSWNTLIHWFTFLLLLRPTRSCWMWMIIPGLSYCHLLLQIFMINLGLEYSRWVFL